MKNSNQEPILSVIITGGASGIGRAVAELVIERGGCVGVLDLDPEKIEDLQRKIPDRIKALKGSVLDQAYLESAWANLSEALPEPINGLVNCAGLPQKPCSIEEMELSEWSRILDSHLTGTFLPCKIFGSKFASSGAGSAIVNLASVLAFMPGPVLAYAAGKSGVVSLTSALAVHWAKNKVRVNAVAPGWTDTPFLRPKERGERDFTPILQSTPQDRLMKPSEIAEVIYFLLSPAASAITGSTVPCDGGVIAGCGWKPYGGFDATNFGTPHI